MAPLVAVAVWKVSEYGVDVEAGVRVWVIYLLILDLVLGEVVLEVGEGNHLACALGR
jgi:hypothetical protein